RRQHPPLDPVAENDQRQTGGRILEGSRRAAEGDEALIVWPVDRKSQRHSLPRLPAGRIARMRRRLLWMFVIGVLTLAVGGYVASISEWYRGKPRDERDVIRVKRAAIVIILSGAAISIGSGIGIYAAGKRHDLP